VEPEERLAERLVDSLGVKPPIAIETVLRRFADIEFDNLPADSDAILLRTIGSNQRPLVIVDKDKAPLRRRFTLAHELGHLLIPWHFGMLSCHTQFQDGYGAYLYASIEAEANRFAAEILLPSRWLRQIVDCSLGIEETFNAASQASVSPVAVGISLCKVLPGGCVFVATDEQGLISAAAKSVDTVCDLPKRGTPFDSSYFDIMPGRLTNFDRGKTHIFWFKFDQEVTSANDSDTRSSKEILQGILESALPEDARDAARMSINGIIGAGNSTYKPSSLTALVSILRQRFVGRDERLTACVRHQDFQMFLQRRAEEIMERRKR
jgi:hypothetical protein